MIGDLAAGEAVRGEGTETAAVEGLGQMGRRVGPPLGRSDSRPAVPAPPRRPPLPHLRSEAALQLLPHLTLHRLPIGQAADDQTNLFRDVHELASRLTQRHIVSFLQVHLKEHRILRRKGRLRQEQTLRWSRRLVA